MYCCNNVLCWRICCIIMLHHEKPVFCLYENKGADYCTADQSLCFHYLEVQSLFFLNPAFQASSFFLWQYRLVCVRPGQKPRRLFFFCIETHILWYDCAGPVMMVKKNAESGWCRFIKIMEYEKQ